MKKQVVVIHGGDTFRTYRDYLKFLKSWRIDFKDIEKKRTDWKDNLDKALGNKYEVIAPKMPNKLNAKYIEWKVWFDKFVPYLRSGVLLVGHSMGGIFLAKYLSENNFPKKINGLFLVAAPFDEKDTKESLGDFRLPNNLTKLAKQVDRIFIYQSKDDPAVPLADFKKYQKHLPTAVFREFKNRGHFFQKKFPELIKDIKNPKT